MFGIGIPELMLIMIIALIVLGPERMPRVARDLGKIVGDLRRTSDELRDEFLNADRLLNQPAAPARGPSEPPAVAAGVQSPPSEPADPNETLFDREMREARERLKAQRSN